MSVRCKMSPQGAVDRGEKGGQLWLGAVYEGSDGLMAVTENAVFGNSTPSGSLNLMGDFPVEKFTSNQDEEYYIDMMEPAKASVMNGGEYLYVFPARKFYQSEPSHHNHDNSICVTFRYSPLGEVAGNLWLGIKNPNAIKWLSDKDNLVIGIKLARGKRSDAEIALRKAALQEAIVHAENNWERYKDHYAKNTPDITKEQHIDGQVAGYRKKLSRAKGELT